MSGKDIAVRAPAPAPATLGSAPWAQETKRESEAAYRLFVNGFRRHRHITVPISVPVVLWLSALLLHVFHCTGFVLLAGILGTAAVAYFASHKWGRTAEQWYARASVAALSLWLWLATWLGPVSGLITACVLGGLLLAGSIAWGIPWYKHKRPRGRRRREKLIAAWNGWWQSHCFHWGLAGSGVVDVREMGVTVRLTIQGVAGRHSVQQVSQVKHLIESASDGHADIGMVRIQAVKGRPSQFYLFLKRENPLQSVVEWDQSLAPRSVHEPIIDGTSETGNWKMISPRKNRFIIGETRSGKSNDLLVGAACLSGCPDARFVLVDLKGGRSARPLLKAGVTEYVITEVDEARLYLRMLVAEAKARAKYAYVDEEEQLLASSEIPALITLFDEVHGLTSTANGDAECARLLALAASIGAGLEIYEWIYTQHGSLEESVRTEQTRSNLPCRTVYRVAEARHGAYAIPEYHVLDASKLDEKGTHYIKDGKDADPEQVRAPHMPHKLLVQIATQNMAALGERPPLALYCGSEIAYGEVTWQQWWDSRWGRLDEAFHKDSLQYQQWAAAEVASAKVATAAMAQTLTAEQLRQDAAAAQAPLPSDAPGEGSGASVAARISQEMGDTLRGVPDGWTAPRGVKLGPVILNQKDRFAAALAGAPPEGISPKQLAERSERGKTWVHQTLTALSEKGAVTSIGRGLYVPVPGADIARVMETIEAEAKQLYRQARAKVNAA